MFKASRPVVSLLSLLSFVSFVTFVSLVSVREAHAQGAEAIGVRAQGMAGAFTAIADDATAGWWNPAGLAGGSYFSTIIEYGRARDRPDSDVKGVSMAFPALGVSYYRLPISQMRPPTSTEQGTLNRQDQGTLSEIGVTVGQSLGNHIVIGTTLKAMHADETHAGLDAGVMATFGRARVGLAVRNLTEATFGAGADALELKRQARAGFALTTGSRGVVGSASVAVDADLTTNTTAAGEERRVAAGAELWVARRILGLRGGISRNMVGTEQTFFSGGLSVVVSRGRYVSSYVDGQLTDGSDEAHRRWGVALRLTF